VVDFERSAETFDIKAIIQQTTILVDNFTNRAPLKQNWLIYAYSLILFYLSWRLALVVLASFVFVAILNAYVSS
jgi:ABC-type bacteriocin/lantibiotic exporter with double-glycine peptidase domain